AVVFKRSPQSCSRFKEAKDLPRSWFNIAVFDLTPLEHRRLSVAKLRERRYGSLGCYWSDIHAQESGRELRRFCRNVPISSTSPASLFRLESTLKNSRRAARLNRTNLSLRPCQSSFTRTEATASRILSSDPA